MSGEEIGWLNSIYFIKLLIRYRALTDGYLGDWPARKLRAVLKRIHQSAGPCLDQKAMECGKCSMRHGCNLYLLDIEDKLRNYFKPYVVTVPNRNFKGRIIHDTIHSFDCRIIGEKTRLVNNNNEEVFHGIVSGTAW